MNEEKSSLPKFGRLIIQEKHHQQQTSFKFLAIGLVNLAENHLV